MADINTNTAADDDAAKAGLSPWEDDLPPEPKSEVGAPQVVGGLEPEPDGVADAVKPVPFNIPENVDEKVGTKVPAEKYIEQPSTATEDRTSPTDNRKPMIEDQKPSTDNRPPEGGSPSEGQPVVAPTAPTPTPTPKIVTPAQAKEAMVSPVATPQPQAEGVSELFSDQTPTDDKISNTATSKPPTSVVTPIVPSPTSPPPTQPLASTTANIDSIKPAPDPFANVDLASSTKNRPPVGGSPSGGQPTADASSTLTALPKEKKKISFPKLKIPMAVSYIGATLLMLSALTYLTELGIFSIGLEKVYGLFQVETLWGGLPKNPERALGMSTLVMKENLDFKASGTVTLTVNKTIKSDITTPLISTLQVPLALVDSNAAKGIRATLTTTGSYYDDYYDPVTVDDSSTGTSSSSSTSSSSNSSTTPLSSDSSATESQDAGSSIQLGEPTIKELKTEFNFTSGTESAQADITINKIVGTDSNISLVASESNLYVKSADIKFDEKSVADKWLKYSLSDIAEPNPISDIMNIKTDNGFTIIGKRTGNEKISDTRCYKYLLSEVELGDALGSVGIRSEMVQSMNGTIWIGIRDHLIRKISLTIIPSVSSSVSRVDLEMEFSEYGTANPITVPSLTNIVDLTGTSPSVTAAAGASETLAGDDKRKSDLASIKTALNEYKSKVGSYPTSTSLDKLNGSGSIVAAALVPNYIESLPLDPKDSSGWYYAYKSDGKTFSLSARLEDATDPSATKSGDVYLYYLLN